MNKTVFLEPLSVKIRLSAKKIFFVFFLLFFSLFLFGFVLLNSSEKLRYFLYKEINYQYLADLSAEGAASDKEKTVKIFRYVHENLGRGGKVVLDQDSWSDLVRGNAYCDQQATVLATLLANEDIPARIVMLINRKEISNHTVSEVLLDGDWKVLDLYNGLLFVNPQTGSFSTINEISNSPEILHTGSDYQNFSETEKGNFDQLYEGFLYKPERAIRRSAMFDTKSNSMFRRFFNSVLRFAVRKGGREFVYAYQDFYLSCRFASESSPDSELIIARNYYLLGRTELARKHYQLLIQRFPQSEEAVTALSYLTKQ